MKEFAPILDHVALFRGMSAQERETALECLGAKVVTLSRGEAALLAGDRPEQIGILLAGSLHVVREDADGVRTLIAGLAPGELFAEVLCCAGLPESPVTVLAETDATVLLVRFANMTRTCAKTCDHHARLIDNMLQVVAAKTLALQGRIELLSAKSLRARIMRYLTQMAGKQGGVFSIPFNREELADYLAVDRSALSRELARLKDDGAIDYWKNQFRVL